MGATSNVVVANNVPVISVTQHGHPQATLSQPITPTNQNYLAARVAILRPIRMLTVARASLVIFTRGGVGGSGGKWRGSGFSCANKLARRSTSAVCLFSSCLLRWNQCFRGIKQHLARCSTPLTPNGSHTRTVDKLARGSHRSHPTCLALRVQSTSILRHPYMTTSGMHRKDN